MVRVTREELRDVSEKATPKVEAHCASHAIAHTHVIVLGRTTSRDVWVVVRCAVGEGRRWSAPRSIFLCFDADWAIRAFQPVPSIAGGCIAGGCIVVVISPYVQAQFWSL